ncbi:MAG: mechanosensitive ion channel family protein, partial [Rhodothermales bacterium]
MTVTDAFSELLVKLQSWLQAIILMLPEFVSAVVVVIIGALLARFVRRAIYGVLRRVSTYDTVNHLLATIAYGVVLAITVFVALGILGLDRAVTSLLAGAGIIGLALGFAFQDLASNFIAGILLSVRRPFLEGDLIETNDFLGTVMEINLRSTKLRTLQGQIAIIPNAEVFTNPLKNFSTGERRIDLACGVSYGDDLAHVRSVVLSAVRSLEGIRTDGPIDLFFEEFGDSSINFTVRFWIDFARQPDFLRARSEAVIAIKKAFDQEGITIPFPIRTLDFGIVGGTRLDEVMP